MALALVSYFVHWSEVLIEKGEKSEKYLGSMSEAVSAALASIIACNPRSEGSLTFQSCLCLTRAV